jgi:hypothetical protein
MISEGECVRGFECEGGVEEGDILLHRNGYKKGRQKCIRERGGVERRGKEM